MFIIRFFKRLYKNICVILSYSKFLWSNHYDWDYYYLLDLLRFKFLRMKKFFESKECISVECENNVKIIQKILDTLDLIIEDDNCKKEWEELYEKWGEGELVEKEKLSNGNIVVSIEHKNAKTKEEKDQCSKDILALGILEEKKKYLLYKKLFNLILKNIRKLWD